MKIQFITKSDSGQEILNREYFLTEGSLPIRTLEDFIQNSENKLGEMQEDEVEAQMDDDSDEIEEPHDIYDDNGEYKN
jgi:hypothetical protein